MRIVLCLSVLLLMIFSAVRASAGVSNERVRGSLVIVGGGLEDDNREVFENFISKARIYKGKSVDSIRVCVVPAGSATPQQSSEYFRRALSAYGVPAHHIDILPLALQDDPSTRDVDESTWSGNASRADVVRSIEMCDAVWFVGGDQMRYNKVLFEKEGNMSPALRALWYVLRAGAVLGGTSAGAAIMSNPMISGGDSSSSLQHGMGSANDGGSVSLMKGPGFFSYGIVDQHFSQRGRLGRLIVASRAAGSSLAFGVDEDTAMLVDFQEEKITAVGRGAVTVVNLEHASVSAGPAGTEAADLLVSSMESGDSYSIARREFSPVKRGYAKIPDGPEKKTVDAPVFEKLREVMVFELGNPCTKSVTGLLVNLQSEEKADGFLVRFRKEADTLILNGIRKGERSGAAFNVHMDIVPVELEIRKHRESK
ncbi:MAG: cyanophycinase [Vulcanimicrobiota bacterium]